MFGLLGVGAVMIYVGYRIMRHHPDWGLSRIVGLCILMAGSLWFLLASACGVSSFTALREASTPVTRPGSPRPQP